MQSKLQNRISSLGFDISKRIEYLRMEYYDDEVQLANIPMLTAKQEELQAFENELKELNKINGLIMGDYKKCSYQGPECMDEVSGCNFIGNRCKKCKKHKTLKCITSFKIYQ